jgi:DNA-binding LacI/PurR family transcriptional regulator
LADDLRRRIRSGILPEGAFVDDIRTLSERYRISYNTVRQALRVLADDGLLDLQRGRRARVVACEADRPLKPEAKRRPVWALVTQAGDFSGLAGPHCWRDCCEAIMTRGMDSTRGILCYAGNIRLGAVGPDEVREKGVEAVFLIGVVDPAYISAYAGSGMHVCLVDAVPPPDLAVDHVHVDNYGGAERAVEDLCMLGHRRFAFIGNRRGAGPLSPSFYDPDAAQRRDAFLHFLGEYGVDPETVRMLETGHGAPPFEVIAEQLWRPPRPTAIVTANEGIYEQVMREAKAHGVTFPGDASIVTWATRGSLPAPEPAAIWIDFREMGYRAADCIKRRLAGDPLPQQRVGISGVFRRGFSVGRRPR